MADVVDALVAQAAQAARAGDLAGAERIWGEVRRRKPDHPQALYSLGVHALQRGSAREAWELLDLAHQASPGDPMILLTMSVVARELGDGDAEWQALNEALARDPYFLPALLSKAAWYERRGQIRTAATVYRNCLKVAPPPQAWPDALRPQLAHAAKVAQDYGDAFAAHLRAALGGEPKGRWAEAADVMAGRTRPYLSDCNQLYVPRLPAIPFFDRREFAWVEALEAKTDAIREELRAALAARGESFTPYIAYEPGQPVNQWGELNHSQRWSTLKLWAGGERVEENLAACPETAKALDAVEMADIGGLCPNAMFSALSPRTEIPPHHGETNARLVVHLPLIVPPGCSYRVGYETREWREGECLIFDDTLEHTARNDGDHLRVVLIFDVWNPLLSPDERGYVRAMTAAARAFHAE